MGIRLIQKVPGYDVSVPFVHIDKGGRTGTSVCRGREIFGDVRGRAKGDKRGRMRDRQDSDGRIPALMMLAAGLDHRDVARVLQVQPEQIKRWMSQPPRERRDKGADD